MKVEHTDIPGVLVIEPQTFRDSRGMFREVFQQDRYEQAGVRATFVQDNLARSTRGALRGLHYQIKHPQGKLICVTRGEIYDVLVDLRRDSPAFGTWRAFQLDSESGRQLYAPPGLAHGYCVLSDEADVSYKCTDYYHPEHERTILWNDPDLGVQWPLANPVLSKKDQRGAPFAEAEY